MSIPNHIRCEITGNLVGTDTIQEEERCPCKACVHFENAKLQADNIRLQEALERYRNKLEAFTLEPCEAQSDAEEDLVDDGGHRARAALRKEKS